MGSAVCTVRHGVENEHGPPAASNGVSNPDALTRLYLGKLTYLSAHLLRWIF